MLARLLVVALTAQLGRAKRADGCYHVFLDLGANIGMHSRFLFEPARFPQSSYVKIFDRFFGADRNLNLVCAFGFEPNPAHAPRHRNLSAAYDAVGWRYQFIPAAVGDKSGRLTFHHNSENRPISERGQELGFGVKNRDRHSHPVSVRVVNLVNFLRHEVLGRDLPEQQSVASGHSLPPAVVIKMDVESAEFSIIPALVETRTLCDAAVKYISIEWHDKPRFLPVNLTGLSSRGHNAVQILNTVEQATARKRELQLEMAAQASDSKCATRYETSELDDESYFNDRTPLPVRVST